MRKGFTLIELLAVIVILAIIALIATPIVLNIINESKESARLRSAEMYLDAVEQSISVEKMNNTKFNPNECTITDKGNLDCDTKDGILEVKVNGDKPVNGSITFEEGKIKKATLEYKNDKVIIMNTEGKLQYQKYISISNYQHKHIDGTIEDHEVKFDSNGHGTCSICMEEVLAAGLYDENDKLLARWDTLENDYGLDITSGGNTFAPPEYQSNEKLLMKIIYSNSELQSTTKVVVKDSVSSIGMAQLQQNINIKEVLIPNSVTSIDGYAFYNCKSLTTIDLGNSVTSIGQRAFQNCTGLTAIKIPNSVTSIGGNAFSGCTGLTAIKIPNSVTSIGISNGGDEGYTFSGCTGLTSIEIPDSVTSIGDHIFSGCTNLTNVTIKGGIVGNYMFSNLKNITTMTLGNGVTSIGDSAFLGCTGLTSIKIPGSVTSIGDSAFSGCTGLTTIKILDGVKSIGNYAFSGCTNLTEITIPDSVTSIGFNAFQGCTDITSIYIPSTVKEITYTVIGSPFYSCSSTLKIYTGVKEGEIPSGWGPWNYYSDTETLSVEYGVTREEYEAIIAG